MTSKRSRAKAKSPKKPVQTASEDEPSDNERDETVTATTLEQVKSMIESLLEEKLARFEETLLSKIDELQESLASTKSVAERALALALENKSKIDSLSSENAALQQRVSKLQSEKLKALEEQIEDRTNRQMRKSLIFKGIEESPNETWEETEEKLAKVMHEVTGTPLSETSQWIERGHRTGKLLNTNTGQSTDGKYQRKGPRVITAGFYDWKDAQNVLQSFIKYNIANKSSVSADQKFGPLTTRRRNEALMERRNLLKANAIKSGYIAYPARLMVKVGHEKSYHLHKDFSKMEVVFRT